MGLEVRPRVHTLGAIPGKGNRNSGHREDNRVGEYVQCMTCRG